MVAGSSFGMTLSGQGLMDATVTHNIVDGAKVGLSLTRGNATFFGALLSLNDITNSVAYPVTTTGTYTFPTDLSVLGVGNYWGHSTTPGFRSTDRNNFLVIDSHPFCRPVAALFGPPPATCP